MNKSIILIFFWILLASICSGQSHEKLNKKDLFISGKGGYGSYRIPSLIVTKKGTVLAFAEGRKKTGDSGDIDLLLKRSFDNGKTWTDLQVVWNDGDNTCGNPTAVVDKETGRIFLFSTWNLGEDNEKEIITKGSKNTRRPFMMFSDDDGETWSKPKDMSSCCKEKSWGWYATGPGIGIQVKNGAHEGRLVIPANYSYNKANGKHNGGYGYGALVLYSDDHGQTWKESEMITPEVNESQVVELSDGTLMMNMRSYNDKYSRAVATSTDGGKTWSKVTNDQQLVESRCQASIVNYGSYQGKDMILFSNPAVAVGRTHMTVRASFNDAENWIISKLIYGGPSAYSCLTRLPNGNIGLFFEAGSKHPYKTMKFVSFSPAELYCGTKLIK